MKKLFAAIGFAATLLLSARGDIILSNIPPAGVTELPFKLLGDNASGQARLFNLPSFTAVTTNFYFFSTNLYVSNTTVSNYFVTNVFANTYVSNYLQTNVYQTNFFNTNNFFTNFFVTNVINNNSYVSNFFQTNINVNNSYVSNYFATNLFNFTTNIVTTNVYFDNWTNEFGLIRPINFAAPVAVGGGLELFGGLQLFGFGGTNLSVPLTPGALIVGSDYIVRWIPASVAGILTNDGAGNFGWSPAAATIENSTITNVTIKNLKISNNITYTTNLFTPAPDFSKGYGYFSTNAAFTFLPPIGLDLTANTNVPTCVMLVSNTTATPFALTAPANCHVVPGSVMWVTNETACTFFYYPKNSTNVYAVPLF